MEDDLKILKVEYISNLKISNVEYLSNHWLDLSQNLDFSLGDQTESKNSLKWRRIQMEDDFQWKITKKYWS